MLNYLSGAAFPQLRAALTLRLAILCVVFGGLCGCQPSANEQSLRAAIDQLEAAGEAREVNAFMAQIAEDFSGQAGAMDALALRRFLIGIQLRTRSIAVTRTSTNITLQGERAKVELAMVVTDSNGLLPSQGQYVRAQTLWRFEQGQWRLSTAQWQEGLAP